MEVTFRTDAAEDSLLALQAAAIPGMCIGAGTVLTVEHAEAALAAGAEFVISPGVNPEVVSFCIDRDVPVFPGIATPGGLASPRPNPPCEPLSGGWFIAFDASRNAILLRMCCTSTICYGTLPVDLELMPAK